MFKPTSKILAITLLFVGILSTVGGDPKTKPYETSVKQVSAVDPPGNDSELKERIDTLIRQLGDADFEKRREASGKLSRLEPGALPKLKTALRERREHALREGGDFVVVQRIQECIDNIVDGQMLAYLERRSENGEILKRIDPLIQQLGDNDFAKRQEASRQLSLLGSAVLPKLKAALKSEDGEVVRRAKDCVEQIECEMEKIGSLTAVVQHVLHRRPNGAIKALLRLLSNTGDDALEETICFGLYDLVAQEQSPADDLFKLVRSAASQELLEKKKPVDGALVAALHDKVPARRAMAGLLVARFGVEGQKIAAKKLLDDADAEVRLRSAQGLLAAKDEQAVPVLIELVAQGDIAQSWQAEELLRWAAAGRSPKETISVGSREAREACHNAWLAWWKQQKGRLNLQDRQDDYRPPGLVLLCDPGKGEADGLVWLVGCDGTTRCQWEGLRSPVEARIVAGPGVLVAEAPVLFAEGRQAHPPGVTLKGRVTERDPTGKVCWEYTGVPDPVACCRLTNGNTFVAGSGMTGGEVRPDGKLVFSLNDVKLIDKTIHKYPSCTPNGQLCFAALSKTADLQTITEFDWPTGTATTLRWTSKAETGAYGMKSMQPMPTFAIEPLNDGRYLLSGIQSGIIVEVNNCGTQNDPEINIVELTRKVPGSNHATRLVNGQTLVAGGGGVATVSARTKTNFGWIIGEVYCERKPYRARPCFGLVRLGFEAPSLELVDPESVVVRLRLKGLKDSELWPRRRAAELLGSMGRNGLGAIFALKQALADPDETMQRLVKEALSKIGAEAVEKRLAQIKDNAPKNRIAALHQLHEYCQYDRTAATKLLTPALLEAIKDQDPEVRLRAASYLGNKELDEEQVVPALIRAIEDEDPMIRSQAAESLGYLGIKAKAAMPKLLKSLKAKDRELRYWAAFSIGQIGAVNEEVVPALVEALKDEFTRARAARALSMIGPAANDTIPAVIEALDMEVTVDPADKPPTRRCEVTRGEIVHALGNFGPHGARAVPVLIRILKDDNEKKGLKTDAIIALGKIGPAARDAIPVMDKLVRLDSQIEGLANETIERIRGNH